MRRALMGAALAAGMVGAMCGPALAGEITGGKNPRLACSPVCRNRRTVRLIHG